MSDRTTWGEKAHLDLLLSILNNVTISNSDWDSKILPELRAKGYTYTVSAALSPISITSTNSITIIMSTPTKVPAFKWDPASERDLFAACLVAADEPKGATLARAMDILKENFGERFTKKAATHRLQHLQKLKKKEGNGAPSKKPATPGKKRGKAATEGDDDESPKKKRKTPVKAAPSHAADDHDDDEDVQLQLKNEERSVSSFAAFDSLGL
ncbi:hypothetical protein UCDDA912_g02671 [Diaporthe ampelina]|uniref:Uncharacterized protein n=1 Tax=Diaporthe ampelina TaxID=1214573 RepID=A0A0G2FTM3_9PEZI|nr:hypothetical protein UCDDA912_g02671 [Diaporthe ampelina]